MREAIVERFVPSRFTFHVSRITFYEHIDESNRAGPEPELAGHQRADAAGGVLHDGHQRGYWPRDRSA